MSAESIMSKFEEFTANFEKVCLDRETPASLIIQYANAVLAVQGSLRENFAEMEPIVAPHEHDLKYWITALNAVIAIDDTKPEAVADIRKLAIDYLCTNKPETKSDSRVAQAMMKAAIHQFWRKNYLININRGHTDPVEAVKDAMTPIEEREIEYMQQLFEDIAAKGDSVGGFPGETVEAMLARIDRNATD